VSAPRTLLTLLLLPLLAACGDKGGSADTGSPTDADGDGFPAAVDCDDADATVFPGAQERCNEQDDDCDGVVDEEPVDGQAVWLDADGDGFGAAAYTMTACTVPAGWADNDQDCDDLTALSHPEADEICDGLDNDCDGNVDESPVDAGTWYIDADGDGYGDPTVPVQACTAPDIYVTNGDDCDDSDPALSPATVWYGDVDGDGYGGTEFTAMGCEAPANHVDNHADCDDRDAAVSPDAAEYCDGIDNDCDGVVDGTNAVDGVPFYQDADRDGYGLADGETINGCSAPDGFAAEVGDCNDADATVSPGDLEVCGDGIDNDCDGNIDTWCAQTLADADSVIDGVGTGDYAGYRLSAGGDLDGDGYADLAVGAYGASAAGSLSGSVFVSSGPIAAGSASLADAGVRIDGALTNDYFGSSVRLGPDATGDGTDDLIVGAWGADTTVSSVGAAYLFSGPLSGSLSAADADATLTGVSSLDYMGQYLSMVSGDLTGDGEGDVVVGVAGDDSRASSSGLLAIYAGPVSGTLDSNDADVRIEGSTSAVYLGYCASAADIDGDGIMDLAFGGSGLSQAYVALGPLSGTLSAADADIIISGDSSDSTGSNISTGDYDGDGRVDLAVGAKYADAADGTGNTGAWRVYSGPLGSALGVADAVFTATELTSNEYLGAQYTQVASGDVDGDGKDDLFFGAPTNDTAGSTAGMAVLFVGPLAGTATVDEADMRLIGEAASNAAGYGVDLADLDGAAGLEAVVGARGYGSGAGRIYLVSGGGL